MNNPKIHKEEKILLNKSFDDVFNEIVDEKKHLAKKAEKRFLTLEFAKVFKSKTEITHASNEFCDCLQEMIFFLPKSVEARLKQEGFSKNVRKWFVDFETIKDEMIKINEHDSFYVDPKYTLTLIELYLAAKLRHTVLKKLKKSPHKSHNLADVEIKKYFKKRSRHLKLNIPFEPGFADLTYQIQLLKTVFKFSEAEVKHLFLKSIKGDVDKIYLSKIVDSIFIVEGYKVSKNALILSTLGLFAVLNLFENSLTENQFYASPDLESYKSYENYLIRNAKSLITPY